MTHRYDGSSPTCLDDAFEPKSTVTCLRRLLLPPEFPKVPSWGLFCFSYITKTFPRLPPLCLRSLPMTHCCFTRTVKDQNPLLAVRFKLTWIDTLLSWAADLELNVSFNATMSVDFCLGRRPGTDTLQVGGVVIPRRTETRHLGVLLSADLRWSNHLSYLLSISAGPVYLCQKLAYQHSRALPSPVARRFYVSFVRPKLEYCSAVWCGNICPALRLFALRKCN